jgi:hypothetical protein
MFMPMRPQAISYVMVLGLVVACAPSPRSKWEDIDYSKVYRAYEGRQNDAGYTPPASVNSCMDDDFCF